MIKIEVKIGSVSKTYIPYETTAIPDYDCFGTISLLGDERRIVVIEEKHLEYQLGKYGSGLYVSEPCDLPAHHYEELLYKKMAGHKD